MFQDLFLHKSVSRNCGLKVLCTEIHREGGNKAMECKLFFDSAVTKSASLYHNFLFYVFAVFSARNMERKA